MAGSRKGDGGISHFRWNSAILVSSEDTARGSRPGLVSAPTSENWFTPLLVFFLAFVQMPHQQQFCRTFAYFTETLFLYQMAQEYYVQFFTATILEWKHLLKEDKYKQLILNSLRFLVEHGRIKVYGFVIMINHIHVIWHIQPDHKREDVQRDFLKYTAQQIKADLEKHHPEVLPLFLVNAKDRKYQIGERNPLSIDIWSREVLWQKLNYMHKNPVRAGVCRWPEEYHWSSALFYHTGVDNFGWLTHVMDGTQRCRCWC